MFYFNNQISTQIRLANIPVVFLHAFPVNQKMWQPQVEFLKEQGINCVSFDYPGFGSSQLTKSEMTMQDYSHLIFELLYSLKIDKAVFVGLSMGGYVALSLFMYYPQLFAGLMLANTRASSDNKEGKQKRLKLVETLRKDMNLLPIIESHLEKFFTPESREKHIQQIQSVKEMMLESTVAGVIQAQMAMAKRLDSTELLKKMNFPVAVVAGKDDELIMLIEAEKMQEMLPDSKLFILDSAHLSNLEQPKKFNEALMDLIQRSVYLRGK